MLNPVYRLAIDAQHKLRLGPAVARALKTTVVIPRMLCVFEHLPSAGVAWHERKGFARLQALRLAPYAHTGATAAVRNRMLMLWLWDAHEVDEALVAAGLNAARIVKIAEPLMLPLPNSSGHFLLKCQGGTDHLLLDRGAITGSRWQPEEALGRAAPDPLRSPWARDLLNTNGLGGDWDAHALHSALTKSCWALALGCGAYFAYWAGSLQGLEERIASQNAQSNRTSTDFNRLLQLKQAQSTDQAWLDNFRRLSSTVRIEPLLEALQRPMEANNLVIKELELRNEDLRLLVGSADGAVDLPRVMRSLSAVPGLDAVQLRQSPDPQQASFTMRVVGYSDIGPR